VIALDWLLDGAQASSASIMRMDGGFTSSEINSMKDRKSREHGLNKLSNTAARQLREALSDSPDPIPFSEVIYEEANELRRRRLVTGQTPDENLRKDLTGLALSGGGIRSATFCLGVLQALGPNLLKRFDYLSIAGHALIRHAIELHPDRSDCAVRHLSVRRDAGAPFPLLHIAVHRVVTAAAIEVPRLAAANDRRVDDGEEPTGLRDVPELSEGHTDRREVYVHSPPGLVHAASRRRAVSFLAPLPTDSVEQTGFGGKR
jgi:hypothetical protein